MPKKTWLWVSFFIVSYGVIALVVRASTLPDSTKMLIVVGHTVLYLSAVFAELSLFRQHFGVAGDWLRSLSNVGRAGKKHELYRAMGNALGYMADHAYVTYFNNKGPTESSNPAEVVYHDQFRKAVMEGGHRSFRRIIAIFPADTPPKRQWVKDETEFAAGYDNYTIRFLYSADESGLPLNVQIFDKFVFLIDPNRDNEDTLPRDIHFLSEEIAEIWFRYYRFIWDSKSSGTLSDGYSK
jgi:hypothetical protein